VNTGPLVPPELARLRERHPGWFITTLWIPAVSGPGHRVYAAQRNGVTVCDMTTEALSARIAREESR
jgi:hypothetical protein